MTLLIESIAAVLILISAFFLLLGSIGLVRLPDFHMRLHAPTKSSTLGLGGLLLASMLLAALAGHVGFAELLISVVVFLTAPVSACLMAQAALHLHVPSRAPQPEELPPQG